MLKHISRARKLQSEADDMESRKDTSVKSKASVKEKLETIKQSKKSKSAPTISNEDLLNFINEKEG